MYGECFLQKSREGAKDAEGSIGTTTWRPDRMAEKARQFAADGC